MNRIVVSPSGFCFEPWLPDRLDRLNLALRIRRTTGSEIDRISISFLETFVKKHYQNLSFSARSALKLKF